MAKKRILIADDEETIRRLLAMALNLNDNDYEIDVVKSGVEAIRYIDERSYDLIITDYMMPNMDGLELTRKIKSKYPSIPILIITGWVPTHDFLKTGAMACITKPFSIYELQNMVEIILNLNKEE